LDSLA